VYQARILDKNRRLVAILPGVSWRYQRELNAATAIAVMIPKEVVDVVIRDEHELLGYFRPAQMVFGNKKRVAEPTRESKAGYADLASFVQIFKGETLKASGKITGRSLGQVITVEALTEEILLEQNRTPAQYGKVWDGWDLADVARDLRFGWATKRVKAPSQWADAIVASSNIDYTTDPGHLMLSKTVHGAYQESGYVTLRLNKSQFPSFETWDRVRWSADSDGLANPEKIVWTTIQTSTDGSSWSAEFDGGLPEEVGLVFAGTSDDCWVRINLYTNDTTSPAVEEGPPVGQTPVVFAVELVARTTPILEIGTIPAVAGVTVKDLDASYATAFEVISKACEQTGWEFNVWDGALNLAENLGVDRTKDFTFRAGTNIEITTLSDGDEDLCNVLTAYNKGQGLNSLELTLTDHDSLADYGPYPRAVEFDVETYEDLETQASEYLTEHSRPTPQYAIAVAFDAGKEPEYGVGDLVQVADPETGTVTTTRIMVESREYAEQGLVVHLELGKTSLSLTEAIRFQRPRDGKDGRDGRDGRDGKPGKDGKDGQPGGDADIPIPQDPEWLGYEFTSHLTVNWKKADYAVGYEVRSNLNWGSAAGLIFKGYAHSHSFVPMSRNFDLYIRAYNAMDEPSVNYDTMEVLLPIPETPSLPTIHSYFSALQIYVTPLPSPAILGYYVYLTKDGTVETDKIPVRAGENLTYQAPSGTTFEVQVSAFDVLGEGDKSAVLLATTNSLDILEIPEIPKTKLEESLRTEIDTAGAKADQAMEDVGDLETLTNSYLNEVNAAKDRITDAEDGLTSAVDRLNSVDSELDGAKQRLLDAEGRLSGVDDEIADAKDRLTGAESRLTATETDLTDARTRLTDAESDLEGLEGVVSTHEIKISNVEGELSTKVSETEFNALEGTVSSQGTTLTQHAGMIATKAEQSEVDTLSEAVSSNTATLGVHATQIAARVTKEVYNLLEDRVEEAEGELVVLADEISTKVSQAIFEDLQSRVTDNEAELLVQADAIQARVTQEVYNTLADRVTTAEGTLEVLPGQIALKASQSEVDTLTGKVEDNEAELVALATEISSKVSQTVFDTLSGTVASQGTQITQNATAIESKADQSVVDTLSGTVSDQSTLISQNATAITQKADKSTVDTLTGRVSAAEATLSTHADEIEARATKEEVDTIEGRVTEAEGQLTVQAGKIEAKAEKTEVDTLAERVQTAEGTLEVLPGQISAKASQSDVNTLTGRVEEAEGQLEILPGQIALKASQSQVDAISGEVSEQASQIELLGNEITLKVQKKVNGEIVVTGIGVGFDEQGQSVVPVLADRFMVVPTVEGEGQYAFLVDSDTGKVYIPGDLTVGGLLRATELQADLAKVLLLQAEVAFLDQANVLHLKADRISVGAGVGFAQTKPSGHLWHFDRHLSSTDGIAPTAATGTSIVPDQGIAGGALEVASGGTVRYDLPMAMDTWTWAGFFSIGE